MDGHGRCYVGSAALADANRGKDEARQLGTVSSVALPIGVFAAGLGTYLFFHERPAEASAPHTSARIVTTASGFVVTGEF